MIPKVLNFFQKTSISIKIFVSSAQVSSLHLTHLSLHTHQARKVLFQHFCAKSFARKWCARKNILRLDGLRWTIRYCTARDMSIYRTLFQQNVIVFTRSVFANKSRRVRLKVSACGLHLSLHSSTVIVYVMCSWTVIVYVISVSCWLIMITFGYMYVDVQFFTEVW